MGQILAHQAEEVIMERFDSTGRPLYPWEVGPSAEAAEAPEALPVVTDDSDEADLGPAEDDE